MHWSIRRTLAVTAAGGLCLAGSASTVAAAAAPGAAPARTTATPIQHLVVIFDENVSFNKPAAAKLILNPATGAAVR